MNEPPLDLGKLLVTYATNMTATCSAPDDTGDRGERVTIFAFRKHTGYWGKQAQKSVGGSFERREHTGLAEP